MKWLALVFGFMAIFAILGPEFNRRPTPNYTVAQESNRSAYEPPKPPVVDYCVSRARQAVDEIPSHKVTGVTVYFTANSNGISAEYHCDEALTNEYVVLSADRAQKGALAKLASRAIEIAGRHNGETGKDLALRVQACLKTPRTKDGARLYYKAGTFTVFACSLDEQMAHVRVYSVNSITVRTTEPKRLIAR